MAKTTITFEDDADNEVKIRIEFDPPIDKNSDSPASAAQCMAMDCWEFINQKTADDQEAGS